MSSTKHFSLIVALGAILGTACAARIAATPERPRDPVRTDSVVPPSPAAEPAGEPRENADRAPIVGVILPQSGSPVLQRYAEYVLQGIRLAVDRYDGPWWGRPVELVVLDNGGDATRSAALIAELERRGASAVIGPLQPQGVAAAARARRDDRLVILSPTASEVPRWYRNVYSLNAGDTQGAETMASYAAAVGLYRVGLLYPRTPEYRRQADAFRRAFALAGGRVITDVAFDPATTTFGPSLDALAAAAPEAVFVPARERDVRQLAPQIAYYALADTLRPDTLQTFRVLGGEAWTSDAVRVQVEPKYLDGVVATTPFYRESPEVAWHTFKSLYENTYRSTLDNAFPALGYDAMQLILNALDGGWASAESVAERLAGMSWLRGATGVFAVRDGHVVRRPFLVRIQDGELVPLTPADMMPRTMPDTTAFPPDTTMPMPVDTMLEAHAAAAHGSVYGLER